MHIVCVGDCGVDHYLPEDRRFCGGITANFARHARDQFPAEDQVHIVSCVGDDDGADLVLAALKNSGIDCQISQVAGSTPVQFIEVREGGEKRFVRYEEGVLRDFRFTGRQKAVIATADLLVAPVYLQIVGLLDELMALPAGGRVAVDFADFLEHPDLSLLDRHVDRLDVAFFGLTANSGAEIESIRERALKHAGLFVITLGPDGSLVFSGNSVFEQPAIAVDTVVDTTGAGDAFAAGFLARWCHGGDIASAMTHGARVAARVVMQQGSYPGMTSRSDQ